MLSFQEKIDMYDNIIGQESKNYADSFNGCLEILADNYEYKFLLELDTFNDIEYWIDKLKSRLVVKEDLDSLEDIMDDYIACG
ncbi:MAG: hypothetical protein COB42_04585 [Sulfurimonas sp.]|nr:MAG: hypothetical protein COB42_04585 [Sulfurimonas sp.]